MTSGVKESVCLHRDCDAVLIPTAVPIRLDEGTEVVITQSLGGAYTVLLHGNLLRIDAKDADALGKAAEAPATVDANLSVEEQVWQQLRTCYDPEIPVDIVELGLVYRCEVVPLGDDTACYEVKIEMTLTAPGCGMGPIIQMEAEQKILALSAVEKVTIELVLDPPWDRSMMSDAARLTLGMF